jgi:alkanesulfonate monooxygenase SsuD/methylene tetrahydromethanopterin reductase-like flavin-dependent oxidoreductase (luciferase family)
VNPGFAVRLATVEPVHHLVGLAVRAEHLGATAVLVEDGDTGRDVLVAVAAMAVATERIALVPLVAATSAAAVRRAGPALVSLAELSDGRVVGAFPAAALRSAGPLPVPVAAVERGRRAGPAAEGIVGLVAEGDRPLAVPGTWAIWSPATAMPDLPLELPLDSEPPDSIAYRLDRHDVEELAAIAVSSSRGATAARRP